MVPAHRTVEHHFYAAQIAIHLLSLHFQYEYDVTYTKKITWQILYESSQLLICCVKLLYHWLELRKFDLNQNRRTLKYNHNSIIIIMIIIIIMTIIEWFYCMYRKHMKIVLSYDAIAATMWLISDITLKEVTRHNLQNLKLC